MVTEIYPTPEGKMSLENTDFLRDPLWRSTG